MKRNMEVTYVRSDFPRMTFSNLNVCFMTTLYITQDKYFYIKILLRYFLL